MELDKVENNETDFQTFLRLEKEFNTYYDKLGVGDQYVRVPADEISDEEYKKEFLSYFEGGYFMWAKEGDEYVGYITGSVENLPSGYKDGQVGHLDSVIVTEKYRHQGMGKIMIESLFEWFREQGIEICQLHVKSKNTEAVDYYKKRGFEVDNLRMWKKI
ncbi:MAG: GNAT family N-acetyltransferase [Candidatus Pacebacteria bacterium]|nr:GNAT family N-acetyltransferase [Candidatus Paceibacterota bacterium]